MREGGTTAGVESGVSGGFKGKRDEEEGQGGGLSVKREVGASSSCS